MELLDAIRQDVLRQKEEEAVNFFSRVSDLRTFIETAEPAPDVNVSLKMCCLSTERLSGDNGTRVTVTDASQRGLFEATFEGLMELTPSKRKQYVAHVTVWDAKGKKGYGTKANMQFRPGGLYEFRQVDGVMLYADTPSGRVQYDRSAPEKIVEALPPPTKRKSPRESPAKKKTKAKARESSLSIDFDDSVQLGGDNGDDTSAPPNATEETTGLIRTRSSDAPRA